MLCCRSRSAALTLIAATTLATLVGCSERGDDVVNQEACRGQGSRVQLGVQSVRSLESRRFNLEQTIAEATEAIEQRQRVLRQAELNLAQVNEQQPTAAHRASQERFVEERRRMAVDIDPEALRAELVAIEEELSRERAALARHDELDRECRERGWR